MPYTTSVISGYMSPSGTSYTANTYDYLNRLLVKTTPDSVQVQRFVYNGLTIRESDGRDNWKETSWTPAGAPARCSTASAPRSATNTTTSTG
jgi:hypothetical protein